MRKFVHPAVILQNMIVELRRDVYESNLRSLFDDAVRSSVVLDANDKEITLTWKTGDILQGHKNSSIAWGLHVVDVNKRMQD